MDFYNLAIGKKNDTLRDIGCYNVAVKFPNKIWKGDSILTKQVPFLTLQIAYNILAPHFLYFILRPLHVPILVAQILAGLLLSRTLLGKFDVIFRTFYREDGVLAVETYAHLGIVFYVFLSGLEMDSNTILRSKKKAISIAIASIIIPMLMGVGFLALEHKFVHKVPLDVKKNGIARGYLFWCLTISVTSFPVLARILAELKLLYTKLGKDALTAAMFVDAYGWILFTLLIPYSSHSGKPLYSVLSTMVFILFCFCVLQPILTPIIERKTTEETWNNSQLLYVLMGTFVCSYITDLLGAHPIVGAFVYGLILPHGKFADLVIEISNDFVTRVISPLYFAGFGLRVNFESIVTDNFKGIYLALLIMLLLAIPKVLSSLIVTFFYGMPARDGVGIGLLLNTKGIMAVILLNIAWDKKILDRSAFSIMAVAMIIMTVMVSPLINFIYKPKFRFMQSQRRTIQKLRFDAELRVVACVHNARQATGITRVLEATNPTRVSPLYVLALHLVELTRQGIALIAAQLEHSTTSGGAQHLSRTQEELETITHAFEDFVGEYNAARFEATSAVSAYATIHEDIYSVTDDKRASLILLPFHKEPNSEGDLEITNNVYRDINLHVLRQPPCSVGIFVDHGLKSLLQTRLRVLMIFIGGPDDREALALAWRMAGHSGIHLSVVRILLPSEAIEEETTFGSDANNLLSTVMDSVTQKELDDEYIFSFKHKALNNNESIVYSEKKVHTNTGEEIPLLLSELDKSGYDLYIAGQGSGKNSSVLSRLLEWCDNPELGVIGDIIASTSFGTRSSLLVVQQYEPGGKSNTRHSKQIPIKNDDSSF